MKLKTEKIQTYLCTALTEGAGRNMDDCFGGGE